LKDQPTDALQTYKLDDYTPLSQHEQQLQLLHPDNHSWSWFGVVIPNSNWKDKTALQHN